MKQNNILLEFMPIVLFFIIYYITRDIFVATLACIIASWVSLILQQLLYKNITKQSWLSTLLITILGGLTIFLHNKTFVMLKPTALYLILASSLLVGQITGNNGVKFLLHKEIQLSNKHWNIINVFWIGVFVFLAVLNLFIALNYSEFIWVKFKVFGILLTSIVATIITSLYIYKVKKNENNC